MEIELLFLGSGTSAGVPMIGCHCEVCSSADPREMAHAAVGCHFLCQYRRACRHHAGTAPAGDCERVDVIDAIVFTHAHADHIMGLDDVRRFNMTRKGPLDVWADDLTYSQISRCFGYAFNPPDPPDGNFRPNLVRRKIDGPFEIAGVRWTPVPLNHGGEQVLGFRVGHLAYCTDVSEVPEESFSLLDDLDVLILGAFAPQAASQTLFAGPGDGGGKANGGEANPLYPYLTCDCT